MDEQKKSGRKPGANTPFSPKARAKMRRAGEKIKRKTRAKVLRKAMQLAQTEGWQWTTRAMIAQAAGVSVGAVSGAYGSMIELKREVMREAVRLEILPLIAQGLAEQSPIAQSAPASVKQRAIATLAT